MALQRVASIEVAVSKRALTQTGRDRENVSTIRRISIPGSVGEPCAAGEVICFPRGVEKPCVDADGGGVSAGGGADHAVRDSRGSTTRARGGPSIRLRLPRCTWEPGSEHTPP